MRWAFVLCCVVALLPSLAACGDPPCDSSILIYLPAPPKPLAVGVERELSARRQLTCLCMPDEGRSSS